MFAFVLEVVIEMFFAIVTLWTSPPATREPGARRGNWLGIFFLITTAAGLSFILIVWILQAQ